MSIAPPGWISSAGWKISRTRPGRSGDAGERETGAEQHGGVRVVPAGVHDALDRRRERQAGVLLQRERVEVGAQGDAALAAARRRRPARCRRAGCAARARPPSARRRRTPWCAARRGRAPVPRAAIAASRRARPRGRRARRRARQARYPRRNPQARRTGRMSWCSSSTVIGHPLLRGPANRTRSCRASPHGAHPDGGVPSPIPPLLRFDALRGRPSAADGPGATDRRAGGSAANGVIRRSAHRTSDRHIGHEDGFPAPRYREPRVTGWGAAHRP